MKENLEEFIKARLLDKPEASREEIVALFHMFEDTDYFKCKECGTLMDTTNWEEMETAEDGAVLCTKWNEETKQLDIYCPWC